MHLRILESARYTDSTGRRFGLFFAMGHFGLAKECFSNCLGPQRATVAKIDKNHLR